MAKPIPLISASSDAVMRTRAEARTLKLTRYLGKPCPYNHSGIRFTCSAGCVECARIRVDAKDKVNPERQRSKTRRWRAANPDLNRTRARKHDAKRRPHRAAIMKAYLKDYYIKNKSKFLIRVKHRKLLQKEVKGRYNQKHLDELFKTQKGLCLCGASLLISCTIDHKTPISRGGTNWPRNLQLLCSFCNTSKGAKTTKEWKRTK